MNIQLLVFFFIQLFTLILSQSNTINKACGTLDSTCGSGQVCISGRCQCDPNKRLFWTGDQSQCRVCPQSYNRLPTRCYKFYSIPKNHSDARADCRRDQADLFSWRDNDDENELISAVIAQANNNQPAILQQIYAWSGGIIQQGRGTKEDYKISWFDPKAPTMLHPSFKDPYVYRYCDKMMMANYQGDPEPTRQKSNGESENCVSFIFVPRLPSRGQICMGDDYCSKKMNYICELTETTIAGIYQTLPPTIIDNNPGEQSINSIDTGYTNWNNQGVNKLPDALAANQGKMNLWNLIKLIGIIIIIATIIGIVVFIVIRKRKQTPNQNVQITPANSMASSVISDAPTFANA